MRTYDKRDIEQLKEPKKVEVEDISVRKILIYIAIVLLIALLLQV